MNALFYRHIKWCNSVRSSGQRNSLGWFLSSLSLCSWVYRPVGMNGGGRGLSKGMSVRELPVILRSMWNFEGKGATTGLTLCATGLYFFFCDKKVSKGSLEDGETFASLSTSMQGLHAFRYSVATKSEESWEHSQENWVYELLSAMSARAS